MRVLVAGASNLVGLRLVQLLVRKGLSARLAARVCLRLPNVDVDSMVVNVQLIDTSRQARANILKPSEQQ